MRERTIYECEKCGKQSENRKVIEECEASHIGLTIEEVKEWKMLQEDARHKGVIVSITKNENTEKAFDKAINDLCKFEKKHKVSHISMARYIW